MDGHDILREAMVNQLFWMKIADAISFAIVFAVVTTMLVWIWSRS